jgi:6-pyruvoyltetrahydropterin/6-carboxytetrahydropterin synthase
MLVTKEFSFDAAHYLTRYHGKCEKLHGHTYKLQVSVEGAVGSNGLVIDFLILKKIVREQVLDHLDHANLNEILENPTAENIVVWIWERLCDLPKLLKSELEQPNLPQEIKDKLRDGGEEKKDVNVDLRLYELKLWETATSFVTYSGV